MSTKQLVMLIAIVTSCWQTNLHASQAMHALVIGNNDYRSAPLKNPINDSHLIAGVLETTGFKVTRLENLSKQGMEEAIADFQHRLPADSVALVYYAGHGAQDKDGKSYLVPVDATLRTGADLPYQAVAVDYYRDVLQDSSSKLNIVILDCCRDKIFSVVRAFRSPSARLSPGSKGSVIVYSTSAGKNAVDGNGVHSPFAHHLAQSIKRGSEEELPLIQVLQMTGRKVAAEINQQPAVEFDLTAPEFYFVKHRSSSTERLSTAKLAPSIGQPLSSPAPVAAPVASSPQASITHWKSLLSEADGCVIGSDWSRAITIYTQVIQATSDGDTIRERAYRGRSRAYLSRRSNIDDLIAAANDLQSVGEKGFTFTAPTSNLVLSAAKRPDQHVNQHDALLITKADPGKKWLWVDAVNQNTDRRGWIMYDKLVELTEPISPPSVTPPTVVSHVENPSTIQHSKPATSHLPGATPWSFETVNTQPSYPQPNYVQPSYRPTASTRSMANNYSMRSSIPQFNIPRRGGGCHNCFFGRRW